MEPAFDTYRPRRPLAPIRRAHLVVLAALGVATIAFAAGEKVQGVTNFGRVTDTIFRGGEASSTGLQHLHDMGVRTVIDLAGKSGERKTCQRLGIKYYAFPMHADERPDDAKVEEILRIMKGADQPLYVHCSAGKHRAGTITALYRLRVQGWTPDQAWEEQESYGFGPAEKHPELYEYVYGRGGPAGNPKEHKSS